MRWIPKAAIPLFEAALTEANDEARKLAERLPHGYLNMLLPAVAAAVALIAALAGYAMVKFFGVVFLGQPREEKLAQAHDAGRLERIGLLWLAVALLLVAAAPTKLIPAALAQDTSTTIVNPPPNVTGALHIGHALDNTLQDVIIRYERLRGKDALWVVGTDHAGIATQMVVERQMAEHQDKRTNYSRDDFVQKVWEWKATSGGQITGQLRRLGCSMDWAREQFTMDPHFSRAVTHVFVELYRRGLLYRDKRLVNWDPKLKTAISDLEVETQEVKGHFWHFAYPLADGVSYEHVEVDADGVETLRETRDYLVVATGVGPSYFGHDEFAAYAPGLKTIEDATAVRAAVLGANDGIVSTASLIVGVAAGSAARNDILLAGVAGLVAGAMSMAAGEYVSVSSQADTENADIAREKRELAAAPEMEHEELRQIYVSRGLSPELAGQVAEALTAHDALGAHLRDELGITSDSRARPLQAALASAAAFAVGALAPVLAVLLWQGSGLVTLIMTSTLVLLGVLGAVAAQLGGNIGLPILSRAPLAAGGVYVLELSSYQIDLTHSLAADVAVLTNITPDHLDRYGGDFHAYAASKERLFAMQHSDGVAIIACDDDPSRQIASRIHHRRVRVSARDISVGDQRHWPALQGPHNAQNAAVAIAALRTLGLDDMAIVAGLTSYPGLPHRMELVGEVAGDVARHGPQFAALRAPLLRRRGRPAHRGGASQAVRDRAARRDREGAPRRVERALASPR